MRLLTKFGLIFDLFAVVRQKVPLTVSELNTLLCYIWVTLPFSALLHKDQTKGLSNSVP